MSSERCTERVIAHLGQQSLHLLEGSDERQGKSRVRLLASHQGEWNAKQTAMGRTTKLWKYDFVAVADVTLPNL
jgi:hypothetical protein